MEKSVLPSISIGNPPEMEKLLRKYGGGNIPALFGDQEDEGLLGNKGEEIINIYLAGFSKTYNMPLYLIPMSVGYFANQQKSPKDPIPPFDDISELMHSCYLFQLTEENIIKCNDECRKYCIEKYLLTLNNREPIAYMCYTGMICFAVPVFVSDKIVGILSTDCYISKKGAIWQRDLIKFDYCQMIPEFSKPSNPYISQNLVDIWSESRLRIQKCEEILGIEQDELLNNINDKYINGNIKEISPDDVLMIIERLKQAGEYLSDLINQKYRLEKESLIGWIRAEMGSALFSVDSFWDKIRWCFENLAKLIGVDYIMLMSYDSMSVPSLSLQCHYGLSDESLPAMQYNYLTSQLDSFIKKIKDGDHIQEIDLMKFRDVPILSILYSLYGKGANYPIVTVSANSLNGGMNFIILGKKNPVTRRRMMIENIDSGQNGNLKDWLRDDEHQSLITITRELGIIVKVFFSIKKIHQTKEEQTNLIESIAHDLKTPINNIMLAADNLRNARMSPERASRTITGVVTQLERLNLFAQKAWMLEQIRQNELIYNDDEIVDVYKIISECRDTMSDLAEDKSIEIRINRELQNWQEIHIDSEKFSLAVMNLIHNGIKYSFPNTIVEIGGWKDVIYSGVVLTFINEGIQIKEEERDQIFERHYRSKDAVKTDPTGSGIGLVLVKEFVDHYKGRIDVRSTEIRFGRFLNIFSLYLPGR